MGLAWWWDPCSSQNPGLAVSTSESSMWGGQFGGPQGRIKIWEELKDLCCVQHSATWLSLWVACRGNWNWWWRALVSVKLKCVTRSDYIVLMLWVYPRLTAQAFSREMIKKCSSLWLSISVSSSVRNWTLPSSRCAAVWPPPVACGMRAQSGRSEGPPASVLSKKLNVQCLTLELEVL